MYLIGGMTWVRIWSMKMSEFVRKDEMFKVPTVAGELHISPGFDFLHHWARNGAWMLKYVENAEDGIQLKNVIIDSNAASWLLQACGLEVCERTFMSETEHEHYLAWCEMSLDTLDFDIEEPGSDDTIAE